MDATLIARYQQGGDIFEALAAAYGDAAAQSVALAAQSGSEYQVNDALVNVKYGTPLNASLASNFWNNVATNPLGGAVSGINNQIGTLLKDILTSPWILGVAGAAIFISLGGLDFLKEKIKFKKT